MRTTPLLKDLRRFAITLCLFSLVSIVAATTIHAQSPAREISMMISADDIVSISRSKEIPRNEFDDDYWGQFEVLIPKDRFPVPAPNCKKNIILRMSGVAPKDLSRSAKLNARWDLFQSLHAIKEGRRKEPVEVSIALGPYMKTKKDGSHALEYCNAFFKLK
jgi:hypothetical protein